LTLGQITTLCQDLLLVGVASEALHGLSFRLNWSQSTDKGGRSLVRLCHLGNWSGGFRAAVDDFSTGRAAT
jgi:hypothetical protein